MHRHLLLVLPVLALAACAPEQQGLSLQGDLPTAGRFVDEAPMMEVHDFGDSLQIRFDGFSASGWGMLEGEFVLPEPGQALALDDGGFAIGCSGPSFANYDFDAAPLSGTVEIIEGSVADTLVIDLDFGVDGHITGTTPMPRGR